MIYRTPSSQAPSRRRHVQIRRKKKRDSRKLARCLRLSNGAPVPGALTARYCLLFNNSANPYVSTESQEPRIRDCGENRPMAKNASHCCPRHIPKRKPLASKASVMSLLQEELLDVDLVENAAVGELLLLGGLPASEVSDRDQLQLRELLLEFLLHLGIVRTVIILGGEPLSFLRI